ncbi:TetR family transcriptional regulator [Agrobacterium tumefaciens]|uniref:TetR/AcrR family transcriptional regulator C-terminal domain-containing protein n=1 Tax=Agrobacterium tumefaciens TaxID=358 RepID=UPI001573BB4D|nr:TetR family transcriptional regulator [Agrobacterium tumefaciens]
MRIVKTEVIATALKLLDEVGMDGLTMRKLADALNIQAPSLYWHFANKDALLEGMADALMEPVAANNPEGEAWDARLGRVAAEVRHALLSRRDAARVFAGTYPLSDNVLRVGSLLIGSLKQAGADDRVASWGAFTVVYFVIGFVIEEQALGGGKTNSGREEAQIAAEFPLAAIAMHEIAGTNADQRFAFGLDLQIRALRALISETATNSL